jgi:acyl carrier protein
MVPDEQVRHLTTVVCSEAAAVLGAADQDIVTADSPLLDIGFDSLTAVEFRNRLTALTGVKLPSMLLFEYPTPSMIAARLAELITAGGGNA